MAIRNPIRVALAGVTMVLAAATAAVVLPGAAHADNSSDFKLTFTDTRSGAAEVPLPLVSMTSVLGDGNYTLQPGTSACDNRGAVTATYWCYDSNDTSSTAWTPQGMTTTSDENQDTQEWNGIRAAMISWYHDAGTSSKGDRVSVLNLDDLKYRQVLLAEPTGGATDRSFKALTYGSGNPVHAGGMLWYGRNLYVADTYWGVRVFSMDAIYQLKGAPSGCDWIGLQSGTYCASNYKYVMVQVGFWKTAKASVADGFCTGSQNPRFSYLTVDRASTPDRLIAGEFCEDGSKGSNGRLVAYPMAGAAPTTSGATLQITSSWKLPKPQIQGAAFDGSSWYFNASYGGVQGRLIKTNTSMGILSTTDAPIRAEDLSLWRSPKGLYSVTDGGSPSERMVYRMSAP